MTSEFKLQENVPLAPFTTLNIGGPARYFVHARTEEDVVAAVRFADERVLSLFVLGGGSNVLISDTGFDGLVLQIAITGFEFRVPGFESEAENSKLETQSSKLVTVGAGEDWDNFVEHCVQNDLAGVECLSGIPGLVGGTPVQNVGAYGQEVSETIVSVRCFDTEHNAIVTLPNADCGFTYRTSVFNTTARGRYIVLAVAFALVEGGRPKIIYKDLIEAFAKRSPTLAEVRETVLKIRRAKSMVIDADDPNSKSAGSFFKNPVVSRDKFREIATDFESVPHFEFGETVKVPAAWLIEKAGFHKGFVYGGAGISTNHTLASVNRDRATAAEMFELMEMIQAAVAAKFGVTLQPEPVFIGF